MRVLATMTYIATTMIHDQSQSFSQADPAILSPRNLLTASHLDLRFAHHFCNLPPYHFESTALVALGCHIHSESCHVFTYRTIISELFPQPPTVCAKRHIRDQMAFPRYH